MLSSTSRLVFVFVAASVAVGAAFQSNQSWPPGVRTVSENSPPESPADEMKTFVMPPGYHVELVASEPLIKDPILIDFDADGRMWAIEMSGYMNDITAANEHDPLCRIVVLEDTNNDGVMDKRTVFADGLVLPRALKVLDHGVLVGEPPHLWLMKDTNGDLKADTKELVTDLYGKLDANVEHNANTLLWALDNWMYTSEVDMYLRLKHGTFEVRPTLARGQWGATEDEAGHVFRNTNESVLHVDVVPTPYYARNPNLIRTRGSYESLEGARNEVNTVWPIRPTPGVNRGYQSGILRPDDTLAAFTSVSAPTVFTGDRLPSELKGNVFVTEPAANLVSRIIVTEDSTGVHAAKAYDHAEFLASTDERFRPVYLKSGPDGTLYVVDLYRGIVQHRGFITEYLRDHIVSHQLEQPIGYGRIYRVVHDTTTRGPKPALSGESSATLIDTLGHPNGWWRETAQRLLVERDDHSEATVAALKDRARHAQDVGVRLRALWTLDGTDTIDQSTVLAALDDPSRDVRVSAIRLSERWLSPPVAAVRAALLGKVDDPDWNVREQLAATLGALPPADRESAVVTVLERHGDDPIVVDAALSGLSDDAPAALDRLLAATTETPAADASITMLAATIVRAGKDAPVQVVLGEVATAARPEWQRSALLRGAEVAILNAPMPGAPVRPTAAAGTGRAAAACPTCPGARSGPGGASAFPEPRQANATPTAAPARGANRGPMLRLDHEPSLIAWAATDTSDLGRRGRLLADRIEWPGKPGASAPVAPLTADEQKRFDAGKEVYETICAACHQPDGRGREKIAPSLVGSTLALAPAAVTARILLNGKEGAIGLMPPLGTSLTDDQVASVLTYVRRAWGQTGTPVDPATIRTTRSATASRTKPWTNDELLRLANGG